MKRNFIAALKRLRHPKAKIVSPVCQIGKLQNRIRSAQRFTAAISGANQPL
jgi:hypothetical protein